MKNALSFYLYSIALAAVLATTVVRAQDDVLLPSPTTQGDVSYVSGGVGADDAAAFKAAESQYALALEFSQHAQPRDVYLAGVKVTLTDAKGNVVLDTVADGPFLLANLPAGAYTVQADSGGSVKRQTVHVRTGAHARAVFSWPADAAT